MDDNILEDLTQKIQSADPQNPHLINDDTTSVTNNEAQVKSASEPEAKPNQNLAFTTPTEAGYRTTNPNDIPAAPRPQPGMTFTPTGGSVSEVKHQLNQPADDNNEQAKSGTNSSPQQP